MARSQVIWVGLAHIKNMGRGIPVADGLGAQTYIALRAGSAEDFEHKAIAIFRKNRFQVFSITNIENEFDVPKDQDDSLAQEKIALFKKLTTGQTIAWGAFYPYGELD